MSCPHDDLPMVRKIRNNGQVYWQCKVCSYIQETNELNPPTWDDWGSKEE